VSIKKSLLTLAAISLGVTLVSRKEPDQEIAKPDESAPPPPKEGPDPPAKAKIVKVQKEPPRTKPSGVQGYARRTYNAFFDDDCMNYGAAVAYYSVFSLAPLLLFVIGVAGLILGKETVQGQLQQQIAGILGSDAAAQIATMMQHAAENTGKNVIGAVVGFVVLLFGATGLFVALQDALNKVWHVKPDPDAGVKAFLTKRLLSFGLILVMAFLLLVSLVISAVLAAIGTWLSQKVPGALSEGVMQVIGLVASGMVIAALFAAIFKVLPDAKIDWRDVAWGAAITSALFTIGKTAIGLYIGKSGTASAYGAAGSLVVIIFWFYYSALILLAGAEFTKIWAAAHGHGIEPEPDAVKVTTHEKTHKS